MIGDHTLITMATILKDWQQGSIGEDIGQLEPSVTSGECANLHNYLGIYLQLLMNLNMYLLLGIYPIEIYSHLHQKKDTRIFTEIFFMGPQTWKSLTCPLTLERIKRKHVFHSQMANIWKWKVLYYSCKQKHGWILQTLWWVKEARYLKVHIVTF